MKLSLLFFSSRGRLSRLAYSCLFIFTIVFFTLLNNIFSFDKYIEYFQTGAANIIVNVIREIVFDITNILSVIIFIFLTIKRLHDFNQKGVAIIYVSAAVFAAALVKCYMTGGDGLDCIFNTILIIFIISILLLCIWPGDKKDNQYGKVPASLFDLGLD